MNQLVIIVEILFWTFTMAVLIGMYKPWVVLWWKDFMNRKMVLIYYGIPGLIALTILLAIS